MYFVYYIIHAYLKVIAVGFDWIQTKREDHNMADTPQKDVDTPKTQASGLLHTLASKQSRVRGSEGGWRIKKFTWWRYKLFFSLFFSVAFI